MRKSIALAGVGTAVFAAGVAAQVPEYGEYELQARSNLLINDKGWNLPPGSSFNSISASINDEGYVAFPVQIVPVPGQAESSAGIWRGRGGAGEIVALHDPAVGGEITVGDKVSINAAGEVAYIVNRDFSTYALWIYDPAAGEPTPVNPFPLTPSYFSSVALTDDGVVGYQGRFGANGRGFASTGAGSSVIHAADNTINPQSPYVYLYSPDMNGQRVIAGKVNVGDTSHAEIRLFAANGNSTLLAVDAATDPNSPFQSFDNGLSVNDAGQVAQIVTLAGGAGRAVYRLEAGKMIEIARVGQDGIVAIDFFAAAINNDGLVAFRGRDSNGQAVFVGDGEVLVRVIGKGDTLATDLGPGRIGQHIDDPTSWPIFSGMPGISDNGDVVVIASLHPENNNQVEWGTGVIVAKAAPADTIFATGFEVQP